ncbi:MAG: TRAP transporter small permease [Kiritimatiellae bacterium]|nr:TRAP transporter small permease [Kiritimatiellia bacterium]
MILTEKKPLSPFWRGVVWAGWVMMGIALAGLAVMIIAVCTDVALRLFGASLKGAYDIVCVAGALTIAGALPLTTARKGHVAIEYFFQRLNRTGRLVADSISRIAIVLGLAAAVRACIVCGFRYLRNGDVTNTIEIPIFWIPWFVAFAFFLTLLVVFYHLTHPRRLLVHA